MLLMMKEMPMCIMMTLGWALVANGSSRCETCEPNTNFAVLRFWRNPSRPNAAQAWRTRKRTHELERTTTNPTWRRRNGAITPHSNVNAHLSQNKKIGRLLVWVKGSDKSLFIIGNGNIIYTDTEEDENPMTRIAC
jgi:hypothetical protein